MRTTLFAALLTVISGPILFVSAVAPPRVNAAPSPTLSRRAYAGTYSSGEEPHLNPADMSVKSLAMAPAVPMTNAQRLARRLAPNRPKFYRSARSLAPRASAVPNANEGCTTRTGTLDVSGTGVAPGTVVSRTPNAFGEYGTTRDAADALRVQFTDCGGSGPVDLVTLNGIADFTSFGGITGFASTSQNLGPGSANYAYIGGTTQTVPRSPPKAAANSFTFTTGLQEYVESAIWRVNANGAVTAQWVNSDGALPTTSIVYYQPEDFLLLTGDAASFEATYGSSRLVTLTFAPI